MTRPRCRRPVGRPRAAVALGLLAAGLATVVAPTAPTVGGNDPERGAALYRRYCAVCHGPGGRGDGPNAAFLEEDRPRDLTDRRYFGRLGDEHLVRVISDGGQAVQASRFMPPWGRTLTPSQVRDLVAYIRQLSSPAGRPASSHEPAAGAGLARELGCPACHRMGSLPPASAGPDLRAEGSRVQQAWLVRFLRAPGVIRPVGYVPLSNSRMPDFQLSDEEAASLTAYLATRRGDGHEESPWLAEPDPATVTRTGRALFRQYACRACHASEGTGGRAGPDLSAAARRLRPGWVMRFISDPQAVDPATPMPNLGVGPDEARAITLYLFGGSPPAPDPAPGAPSVAEGRALFAALACAGCHDAPPDAAAPRVGPDLTGVGDRLRPDWLTAFLARPFPVRPGLAARMPNFRLSEREGRELATFLGGLREPVPPLPERLRFRRPVSPASAEAGRRLASREFFSCGSCHVGEGPLEGPPEAWAPDFRISARRLEPDWIVRWLLDPQRVAPGTRMPSYFSDADSGPEEVLDGDEERQILALRDYILSLESAGPGKPR